METCRSLPAPEVCRIEKFVSGTEYWTCLVEEPASCPYVVTMGCVQICAMASKQGTWLKQKIDANKIAVRYLDASLGIVSKRRLDELIESGAISAFQRSSGWVDLACDPIREGVGHMRYSGLQRRADRESQMIRPRE